MQLIKTGSLAASSDLQLIEKHLPLQDSRLIELGCGTAFTTRRLLENFPIGHLLATEVDQIQHQKNLQITDLPNASFTLAGMEKIPAENNSFDAAIMLKSLHHVPRHLMQQGFSEIHRILKPAGLLYISEPVFHGEFNEILRLFNDEQQVRQAAFDAIKQSVSEGLFKLKEEEHFISQSRFQGFEDFENRILNATHSDFQIDKQLYMEIKNRFERHLDNDGLAVFNNPMRVDILERL